MSQVELACHVVLTSSAVFFWVEVLTRGNKKVGVGNFLAGLVWS